MMGIFRGQRTVIIVSIENVPIEFIVDKPEQRRLLRTAAGRGMVAVLPDIDIDNGLRLGPVHSMETEFARPRSPF